MKLLATIVLFSSLACCAIVYARRARATQRSTLRWSIAGAAIFSALFFGQNWFLDEVWMPRWFARLIVRHSDPLGFMLVMAESTICATVAAFFLLPRQAPAAPATGHLQLVGRICALCAGRILAQADGTHCAGCGAVLHGSCARTPCPHSLPSVDPAS